MAETYSEYLRNLHAGLKAGCGGANTNAIFAEAKSHLEEGIAENVARGMTRELAETAAMDRFGGSEAVCAWYAEVHRKPSMLRASRGPLLVLGSFLILQRIVFSISTPYIWGLRIGFLNLFFLLTIIACWRSRRFTLPILIPALGLLAICFWISFLFLSVPAPGQHGGYYPVARSSVNDQIKTSQAEIAKYDKRIALFQLGSEIFKSTAPPDDIGEFKDPSGGYRAPFYFEIHDSPHMSVYLNDVKSDGVIKEWRIARQFWMPQALSIGEISEGPDRSPYLYIRQAMRDRRAEQRIVDELPALAARPWSQNMASFAPTAALSIYTPALFAIAGDTIGGLLRLLVGAIRRRNMRKRIEGVFEGLTPV